MCVRVFNICFVFLLLFFATGCWFQVILSFAGLLKVERMVREREGGGAGACQALQAAQYTLFSRLFAMRAAGFGPLKG